MKHSGLVSVSFRDRSVKEIIIAAKESKLECIEWGSDVHAPYQDVSRLQEIAALQKKYGIRCCSYGTYFELGLTPLEELPGYIEAARILGTHILRLWAGVKKSDDYTKEERDDLFAQCRQAAAIAKAHNVILCMECHMNTYTQTQEGALELMRAVDSPHFRMYWQPNFDSVDANRAYIAALQEYIMHVHVSYWKKDGQRSLQQGFAVWEKYLSQLTGERHLLLEFLPENRIESMPQEASALRELIHHLQ